MLFGGRGGEDREEDGGARAERDGTRDETRRGGGGAPIGVGHEKVFREIKKQKPNTYPMA